MVDAGDEWLTEYFQPAAEVHDRKQISEWAKAAGHWSGSGKHVKAIDIKGKLHAGNILGEGATARVEKVTFRSVTMARKRIRIRGMFVEQLREEANIMEKLVHRHIVELVGTYAHGQNQLYILTYPAATCNLQGFLDDIEDVRSGTADEEDVIRRFEALGFKGISFPKGSNEDMNTKSLKRPLSFLSSVLGCVTEAVAFVHQNGVRHRDLKPKNILLSPRQVYLADFGVSRDLRDSNHSITEGIAGTRWYLAPEVAHGEMHHMSPADIFSLGCVFLAAASVIYSSSHGQYEIAIGEADQNKKAASIAKYLNDLRQRASRLGNAAHDAPTCAPKHLLSLIETMLSQEPKSRPTACQVNSSLHELGGIDQVYHGKCCKKDTEYISKLIDGRFASVARENVEQAKWIQQLEAQHELDKLEIERLSKTQETYQSLVQGQVKHVVDQYKTLLERCKKELETANTARKSLEVEVSQLKQQRRPPRHDKKFKPHLQTKDFAGNAQFNSRVPVPTRPSTPLRPHYSRDSSATSDSTNSIFSKTTAASNESLESAKSVRSSTPESPTLPNTAMSPILPHTKPHEGKQDAKPKATDGAIRTWAEMVRKPIVVEKAR